METPFYATPTQRCLVYDKRTGQVIHVHDFIGTDSKSRLSTAEMETQALTYAGDQIEKEHMSITEATGDLDATDITYRVDIGTGAVIATSLGQNPNTLGQGSPAEESSDLDDIKRGLATWKTVSIIALLIAIVALVIGWAM